MKKQVGQKQPVVIAIIAVVVLGLVGLLIWRLTTKDEGEYQQMGATAQCGDVFQCIEQLDPNSGLEDMNALIGSDAEVDRQTDDAIIYKWTIAADTTIEARFSTYDDAGETKTLVTFNVHYPESIVPHNADLSRWEEIQTKMGEENGINYEEMVEMVGGAKGLIDEKSQNTTGYRWFDKDDHYLSASFDNATGKCTFATADV